MVDFIRESKDKYVFVKIEWSDKCARDGDLKITKNQLKKTEWNPNVPVGGAWQEDFYHKLMNKGWIFNENGPTTVTLVVYEYLCDFMGVLASKYSSRRVALIFVEVFFTKRHITYGL